MVGWEAQAATLLKIRFQKSVKVPLLDYWS